MRETRDLTLESLWIAFIVSLARGQNLKLAWYVSWNHGRIHHVSEAGRVVIEWIALFIRRLFMGGVGTCGSPRPSYLRPQARLRCERAAAARVSQHSMRWREGFLCVG